MDSYSRLVVNCGREYLRFLAWNGRVGVDKLGHYTAHCFDTECKRGNIQQNNIACTALVIEDCALDCCTNGYHFVGVYALRWLLTEVVFNQCLNGRNTT